MGLIGLYNHDLFGVGYEGISSALSGQLALQALFILCLLKIAATSITIGGTLTENFAMIPVSSVSAYIFAHPGSTYFNLGKIGSDQLKDYAERKNFTVEEASRWLSQNL